MTAKLSLERGISLPVMCRAWVAPLVVLTQRLVIY